MDSWTKQPDLLEAENVSLLALRPEHLAELQHIAADKRIWEYYAFDCSVPEVFNREFEKALAEKAKGEQFPFVIYHKSENKLIGSTRLLYLQPAHRKLEIGWTWLHPDYWHSGVNAACKALLLTHCFDVMKAARVQLRTDEANTPSRKAIEKTGARFEGIVRNDMIREDGSYRNSAYYSLLEGEWPGGGRQAAGVSAVQPARAIPMLRVSDYDAALDFYVGRLGFKVNWERKPDEGPFQLEVSLKEIVLLLVQYPDKGVPGSWVLIPGFKNLVPYRKLMALKAGGFKVPPLKQVPFEPNTLSMTLADPFGNRLEFREQMR